MQIPLENVTTTEDIFELMKQFADWTPSLAGIFKGSITLFVFLILIIEKFRKVFSNTKWTWKQATAIVGMNNIPPKLWIPPRLLLPKRIMDNIASNFKKINLVHGPPNSGREIRRIQYIVAVSNCK
jgi:hypothetical protein